MYLYETHLHTSPVSRCARAGVEENVKFYKELGYAGIFITNHFIDGNINALRSDTYENRINFFFSDYENGVAIGKKLEIDVFFGVEISYLGTDFLVYGLDKQWFLERPELESMQKKQMLSLMANDGALIIHAHPFREANYIDHIRLFPRNVHGVETYNACRTDFDNKMAEQYAENYGLLNFAGSDNHVGCNAAKLGGMASSTPIKNEIDFAERVKRGELTAFQKRII